MSPLVPLSAGVVAGVALGAELPVLGALPALVALLALQLAWWSRRGPVAGVACLAAGLAVGAARVAVEPAPPRLAGEVSVRGRVVGGVWGRSAIVARADGEPGRVLVRFPDSAPPVGATVVVDGQARGVDPTRLPGEPDPVRAARLGRYRTVIHARDARVLGGAPIEPRLPASAASGLLHALVDGHREGIDDALADRLRRTGTWHLVSISGLHVGLCAAAAAGGVRLLSWGLRARVPAWALRALEAGAAVSTAAAYTALAGWCLPAQRALVMTAVVALLAVGRRTPAAWPALGLAAAVTLVVEPAGVGDPSWQLSFGALAGILLLRHRLLRWLPPDAPRWARWPVESVVATVGATAGTLPVVAWRFQEVSWVAPLANLWAVPWVGAVATPAILLAQLLPAPAAALPLWLADHAVRIALAGLAPLDVAPLTLAVGPVGALGLAAAVGVARWRLLDGLLIAGVVVAAGTGPGRGAEVWFLAVGQGDATLVRWADGRSWLIDGGPPGGRLLLALRRLGVERLDRVYLSHPHPDHLGGLLAVADALPVGSFVGPRPPREGEADYAALVDRWGLVAEVPDDRVRRLHPPLAWVGPGRDPVNDESLVVAVRVGARRFLFPGDIEAVGERELVDAGRRGLDLRADVVKVPHHGSRTSSAREWVERVAPALAVVSCGWENRYRHPHPEALASYRGARLWRTDRDGSVVVRTDGRTLDVLGVDRPARARAEWP